MTAMTFTFNNVPAGNYNMIAYTMKNRTGSPIAISVKWRRRELRD